MVELLISIGDNPVYRARCPDREDAIEEGTAHMKRYTGTPMARCVVVEEFHEEEVVWTTDELGNLDII